MDRKIVLSDADMTLIDTSKGLGDALMRIAADRKVDISREKLLTAFLDYRAHSILGLTLNNLYHRVAFHFCPQEGRGLDGVDLYPDTIASLERLRQADIPVAFISDGPQERLDMILDHLGIKDYFAGTLYDDGKRKDKPHPDVALIALEKMGSPEGRIYVLGDSPVDIGCGVNLKVTGRDVRNIFLQRNGHELLEGIDHKGYSLTEAVDYILEDDN